MASPFTATLVVERYLSGVRIDSFLARHFRNYTPFRLQRIVSNGQARVDGLTVSLEERVFAGQTVEVRLVEPPDKLIAPEQSPLEILYEDPWLIAINKPAGQVAHPVADFQEGTLANALQAHLDQQTPLKGLLRPGIVHRLDRLTSGVIVAAKEHLSHRLLSLQFQEHRVQKSYLALVEGTMHLDEGTINLPIGQRPGRRTILMSTDPEAVDPRPAVTRFQVLERRGAATLVRALPLTGRIHQIRVHFAAVGHPIVGDEFYGPFGMIKPNRFDDGDAAATARSVTAASAVASFNPAVQTASVCEADEAAVDAADIFEEGASRGATPVLETSRDASPFSQRHALHADRLQIWHPILGHSLTFTAPAPPEFFRS